MITDLGSFLKVSCHTKFRFAEREAQCILGECGPLILLLLLLLLCSYQVLLLFSHCRLMQTLSLGHYRGRSYFAKVNLLNADFWISLTSLD